MWLTGVIVILAAMVATVVAYNRRPLGTFEEGKKYFLWKCRRGSDNTVILWGKPTELQFSKRGKPRESRTLKFTVDTAVLGAIQPQKFEPGRYAFNGSTLEPAPYDESNFSHPPPHRHL